MRAEEWGRGDDSGDSSPSLGWTEYFHAVPERVWIVILCTVLAGIGSATYMHRKEAEFQARAIPVYEQSQLKVPNKVRAVIEEDAGGDAIDPLELLATQAWRDVLKEAGLIYDRVVADSAPVLAVSGTL